VCISAISQHHRTQAPLENPNSATSICEAQRGGESVLLLTGQASQECKKSPCLRRRRVRKLQELSLKKPIIVLLPVMSSFFSDEISAVHVMIVGGFFMRPEASFATIAPILHSAKLLAKPISLTSLFYSISFQIA
jgi:hypothetical protein